MKQPILLILFYSIITFIISYFININVPEQYMDEIFHVNMSEKYDNCIYYYINR